MVSFYPCFQLRRSPPHYRPTFQDLTPRVERIGTGRGLVLSVKAGDSILLPM